MENAGKDWFLKEWMYHAGLKQVDIMERAGWTKRKASESVTGVQRYNRDSLNQAAAAIGIEPFEMLMHPEDALEIRAFRRAIDAAAKKRRGEADSGAEDDTVGVRDA